MENRCQMYRRVSSGKLERTHRPTKGVFEPQGSSPPLERFIPVAVRGQDSTLKGVTFNL